jgi:Ca2+-binding RTX toxin-like protein
LRKQKWVAVLAAADTIFDLKIMASFFFDLAGLNGSNGFTIDGPSAKYDLGRSVSNAGDVNGDGIDDLLIGADCTGNGDSINQPGYSYVIFGKVGSFPAKLDLASLNGTNGFVIKGVAPDDSTGYAVSGVGDVNGDGVSDLLIGARFSDIKGDRSGVGYVVYGQRGNFSPVLDLASLNGSNGFRIDGLAANDRFGRSVSRAGDVNGDGLDDFIVGARLAKPDDTRNAGQSYVVFGRQGGFPSPFNISSLDGSNGFAINGAASGDDLGFAVAAAGDINGDGFDDVAVGALTADINGQKDAGQSYIIFGKASGFAAKLTPTNLNGTDGFVINGRATGDLLGHTVDGIGDINGDGIEDFAMGAPEADPDGKPNAGQSYVIFGSKAGFPAQFDLASLNGSNGFTINGNAAGDQLGSDVNGVGDVNNDGIADFVVGAVGADPGGKANAGQVYLIFGRRGGFSSSLNVANLSDSEGIVFNGKAAGDELGRALSHAGDINKDGIADLVIGTFAAEPTGFHSGQTYVIYGGATLRSETTKEGLKLTPPLIDASDVTVGSIRVDLAAAALTINAPQPSQRTVNGFTDVIGTRFDDRIVGSDQANALAGNRGNDTLAAGAGDDTLAGEGGNDTQDGGAGNDRFLFDADTPLGSDTLIDASGTDTLDFSETTTQAIVLNLGKTTPQLLNANLSLSLSDRTAFENASGGRLNDRLIGNRGNNALVGNAGNDILLGGAGRDTLTGDAGRDRFVFDLGSRFKRRPMGVDQISDFARKQDKIVLDRTTFRSLKKGRLKSFDKVRSLGQAKRSDDQIVYIRKTGSLFYNANGDKAGFGSGGLFADLRNGLNLAAKDIVVQG